MDMKRCPCCERELPLAEYFKRADGRPVTYCRECSRKKEHAFRAARNAPIVHKPDPLNLVLSDMPGIERVLIGVPEWREVA